ncbi:MAG: hypothetical protein V2A53_01730 [bacterium]
MSRKTEGIYMSAKDLKNLRFVLEYVIDAEERSYEEYACEFVCGSQKDDNYDVLMDKKFYNRMDIEHIYAIARRVKDVVDCGKA